MTVLLATVFFLVTFTVTLVISLPTPAPSTSPSSHSRTKREVITITQTRAGNSSPSTRSTVESSTTTCIPIDNPNIPTKITLSSSHPPTQSYELIGYTSTSSATTLCSDDDSKMSPKKLSNSLELNSRRPVCSFKLGKRTLAIYPVGVSFTLGSNVVLSYSGISDPSRCFDLCNEGSFEARYPESVEIWERDGVTKANNFIQVSSSTCDEMARAEAPSFLRIDNQNGRDLVNLTRKNEVQVVAFQIKRVTN